MPAMAVDIRALITALGTPALQCIVPAAGHDRTLQTDTAGGARWESGRTAEGTSDGQALEGTQVHLSLEGGRCTMVTVEVDIDRTNGFQAEEVGGGSGDSAVHV